MYTKKKIHHLCYPNKTLYYTQQEYKGIHAA